MTGFAALPAQPTDRVIAMDTANNAFDFKNALLCLLTSVSWLKKPESKLGYVTS